MSARANRVLIVEDEPMLAMDLESMLESLSFEIAGSAGRIETATRLASGAACDVAILDLNLGGTSAEAVADILSARGIPFIFATGYGDGYVDERFASVRVVEKPYDRQTIEGALSHMLGSAR
jgi:DNA-binding NarL/FixJ family response regulator